MKPQFNANRFGSASQTQAVVVTQSTSTSPVSSQSVSPPCPVRFPEIPQLQKSAPNCGDPNDRRATRSKAFLRKRPDHTQLTPHFAARPETPLVYLSNGVIVCEQRCAGLRSRSFDQHSAGNESTLGDIISQSAKPAQARPVEAKSP